MDDMIIIIIDYFSLVCLFFYLIPLIALLIIAVLGCIVRGYYMFMVGFDLDTRSYFIFPTSIIAIPTGIKILNRLATI